MSDINLQKRWTRRTHDFNNETREWIDRPELKDASNLNFQSLSPLGIHALDNGKWSSLYEITFENSRYAEQYELNPPTKQDILDDLEKLEKFGLVKSKSI